MTEIKLTSFIKDSASVFSFAEDIVSLLEKEPTKEAILRPIFQQQAVIYLMREPGLQVRWLPSI